ncbi:NAD(P)-dependent oxidoreductase [Actinomadura sp. WMMB 499]|uniref:NAD(P)-dependent oxidoreductase n=1 Tax=Actinomadura sp. WMMB 499 TaxID=1219491 RepID=UPI001245F7FB|nr:NAD(P)H-binding protein [Actinomadura sp. WMMB 499]QFG24112.1 NAD(P)H-binding protein [Actinomadura sp. WMMB 499]
MKLTIIAATGGTGRILVDLALAAGHDVTAVARRPRDLPDEVRTVRADMQDDPDLRPALEGADAVFSCLGPRSKAEAVARTCAKGTAAAITGMRATGVRRLIVISSESMTVVPSPDRPNPPKHDPGEGFLLRHVVGPPARKYFLREQYADLGVMEDAVRASGLDWTIARPALLVDRPPRGTYRTAVDRKPKGGFRIARADLAEFMLGCLTRDETIGQAISLNY